MLALWRARPRGDRERVDRAPGTRPRALARTVARGSGPAPGRRCGARRGCATVTAVPADEGRCRPRHGAMRPRHGVMRPRAQAQAEGAATAPHRRTPAPMDHTGARTTVRTRPRRWAPRRRCGPATAVRPCDGGAALRRRCGPATAVRRPGTRAHTEAVAIVPARGAGTPDLWSAHAAEPPDDSGTTPRQRRHPHHGGATPRQRRHSTTAEPPHDSGTTPRQRRGRRHRARQGLPPSPLPVAPPLPSPHRHRDDGETTTTAVRPKARVPGGPTAAGATAVRARRAHPRATARRARQGSADGPLCDPHLHLAGREAGVPRAGGGDA